MRHERSTGHSPQRARMAAPCTRLVAWSGKKKPTETSTQARSGLLSHPGSGAGRSAGGMSTNDEGSSTRIGPAPSTGATTLAVLGGHTARSNDAVPAAHRSEHSAELLVRPLTPRRNGRTPLSWKTRNSAMPTRPILLGTAARAFAQHASQTGGMVDLAGHVQPSWVRPGPHRSPLARVGHRRDRGQSPHCAHRNTSRGRT